MSVNGRPFGRWDLRRMFETDPLLSPVDRAVAIRLLGCMDKRWRPVLVKLDSQAVTGARVGVWRETVNRSLRKLVHLGYYATTWRTVQRRTLQGIRGVTRVQVSIGPVVRQFTESQACNFAAQRPSVMSHHPPRTPPGENFTVGGSGVTNSADRTGLAARFDPESRRKAIEHWPRLAGRAAKRPDPISNIDLQLVRDPAAYRRYLDQLEQDQARRSRARRRADLSIRARIRGEYR